jgi:protein ImuB
MRYFGGEQGVLTALSRALAHEVAVDVLIGVADGAFAAEQAARRGIVVPPGASGAFLAELPVRTLDPELNSPLIDLLTRLGLRTLGDFAALPPRNVLARFGPAGVWAHRQAGGRDDRPIAARRPPVEFSAELDFEPALDRIDMVAFSARGLAEQFIGELAAHGLACTCLELQAFTDGGGGSQGSAGQDSAGQDSAGQDSAGQGNAGQGGGEQTVRRWRHAGVLSASDVLDRVRWQLQGWLEGAHPAGTAHPAGAAYPAGSSGGRRPTGGVSRLRLIPIETVPTGAHQQSLWGGAGERDERAGRALARVQTLLGHGSVLTAVLDGGRDPSRRTRLVAWGDEPAPLHSPEQPWPGRLPAPAPTVLLDPPRPIQVLDEAGRSVLVTERGAVPMPPATLLLPGDRPRPITSWAGPWPVDERWWTREHGHREDRRSVRARFQLVDVQGQAYLACCTLTADQPPSWTLEGRYD